ncbi:F0F1 ATP synthase subunit epsilon [Qingshengfaniella alkalisoli]|uniref:ATP synthase epsilon chain n=1 Tax=Qingshengfaniella alkalisoli TaxID=2599296 RepID=A0A5B8IVC1_9RHOB|nr:F0F1 ATP synthase subunit epsilon [Qingshengfaniella alkalisoli]QDY68438.1 F0F1 ATP synthase subunit epsilon [Qingshengfaniella alkalisoli]
MADTMQFDLVSPERRLASGPVTQVQIPAAEGDLTAMPNHAPLITTLKPGILIATGPDGTQEFAVTGGFAEISAEGVSVLAERSYPRHPDHKEAIQKHLDEARNVAQKAQSDEKSGAEKIVDDLVRLLDAMD